jgi:hypothetical protein
MPGCPTLPRALARGPAVHLRTGPRDCGSAPRPRLRLPGTRASTGRAAHQDARLETDPPVHPAADGAGISTWLPLWTSAMRLPRGDFAFIFDTMLARKSIAELEVLQDVLNVGRWSTIGAAPWGSQSCGLVVDTGQAKSASAISWWLLRTLPCAAASRRQRPTRRCDGRRSCDRCRWSCC